MHRERESWLHVRFVAADADGVATNAPTPTVAAASTVTANILSFVITSPPLSRLKRTRSRRYGGEVALSFVGVTRLVSRA
jgi:hypothetical protein